MADNQSKASEALQQELESLRAQNQELQKQLEDSATTGKAVVKKIKGKVTLQLQTPEGEVKKTIGFRDGNTKVRLRTNGAIVSSEAILRIANGGEATEAELIEYPALADVTAESAKDLLTHLAAIGAAAITIS